MNNILAVLMFVVWIITVLYYKRVESKKRIDKLYVQKKNIFRIYTIVVFSLVVYLILNPKIINDSTISFRLISLYIVLLLCLFVGDDLYFMTGPVLSKKFVSELHSDYFAVYLRCFKKDFDSIEEKCCDILKKSIPIFAIGEPHEVISKTGIERLYTSDDDWEEIVVELMIESQMILVRPSDSEGCLIELNHIVEKKLIDKCLFLVSSAEEVLVLCNNLRLRKTEDLEILAKNIPKEKILGLKIDTDGRYSSFLFDLKNCNISFFLNLYGIEIEKHSNHVHLTIIQHIADRVTFVLNPLFYTTVFQWGYINKIIVLLIMTSPIIFMKCYTIGLNLFFNIIFLSLIFMFFYYLIKASQISQSINRFASATHYMTRVRFLYYFNIIFIIAFLIALLFNPLFAYTFLKGAKSVLVSIPVFVYLIIKIMVGLLGWPLMIILFSFITLFIMWKKRRRL